MTTRQYRLADFIRDNMEAILQEWENFARTIEPPALTMNDEELRDHARVMLLAFADDLAAYQSDHERIAKSKGLGKRDDGETAAEAHAQARLLSGFTVVQLVSEYRALRSSVLALWREAATEKFATDMGLKFQRVRAIPVPPKKTCPSTSRPSPPSSRRS